MTIGVNSTKFIEPSVMFPADRNTTNVALQPKRPHLKRRKIAGEEEKSCRNFLVVSRVPICWMVGA